jgi:hypothetical protein
MSRLDARNDRLKRAREKLKDRLRRLPAAPESMRRAYECE